MTKRGWTARGRWALVAGALARAPASARANWIQAALDALPPQGGTVRVPAGTHLLSRGIHIRRSHVALVGEPGAVLRLADGVLQPVVLVGSDAAFVGPDQRIEDVRIARLGIDGNRDGQRGPLPEYDPSRCADPAEPTPKTCWIRNNAIDVRGVSRLRIEDVDAHHARSGGLVVSWGSSDVFVTRSSFHDHWFDGIALYDSRNLVVTSFLAARNQAAGISIDNDVRSATFSAGQVRENGASGVFVRHSRDVSFAGVQLAANGEHGAFLSHAPKEEQEALAERGQRPDTGVYRIVFSGCSFADNGAAGIFLAAPAGRTRGNAVLGSLFSGNAGGPTAEASRGSLLGIPTNVFTDALPAAP